MSRGRTLGIVQFSMGRLTSAHLIGVMFAISNVSMAQVRDAKDQLSQFNLSGSEKTITSVVQQPGLAMESTVDPGRYFVGPSDGIAVNIWMSPPVSFFLTVTPEGSLIIPTVGEVQVADIPLSEAKARILVSVGKKYLTAEITATLVKPRPIIVYVGGSVRNPGMYTLTATDRTNRAIEVANVEESPAGRVAGVPSFVSLRNIFLRRKDGTQQRVDLTKYLATHQDDLNPYLREGDVITVPRKNEMKNVFGIYGEVNAPGRYEYVAGDSVLDALRIAQGFTRLAISDSVELSRLNADAGSISARLINLNAILEGRRPNIALESGDRLVVKARIDLREDYRVKVEGEVLYPGFYPITKNRTRLSEVIQRAGGVTDFAALRSAELIREPVDPRALDLERIESLRGGVSPEDSAYYLVETGLRLRKEAVTLDFERLLIQNDSTQDVILRSEDEIHIPSVRKTIYVFGQVVTPGHVPVVANASVEYYIRKAGGYTDRARTGDVKIVKARTKQWLSPEETTIEEGDYIWVPKEIERPFAYYMSVASQSATVLSVLLGVAALIISTNK